MTRARHSLRGRIVLTIITSVAATSLIFGLAVFVIAYGMEDRLFEETLAREVAMQQGSWQRTGALAAPDNPDITIYRAVEALPPDIRTELAESPRQTEFFGRDGRHYHLRRFDLNDGREGATALPAFAVFEVSKDLLVRPYRQSIIVMLISISLLLALVMATFGWWLVNRAMRPLGDLAARVAGSDTAIPVIRAGDFPSNEIGTLAEALEQAFDRISGFVERERAFTRDASHELRTPLAVIRGAGEVIGLNRDLPAHLAEPLRRIEAASSDMALALDQLLSLARENEGVSRERVVLRPLVDKALSWAAIRFPASRIDVTVTIEPQAAVLVHPVSLQLVLNNLIGNCFQHVGKGQLAISFKDSALVIADDGPGLEAGMASIAPFNKGSDSTGTGLGLDISRRLCDAMGVSLVVGEGSNGSRGAHFTLGFAGA